MDPQPHAGDDADEYSTSHMDTDRHGYTVLTGSTDKNTQTDQHAQGAL